MRCLCVCVCVFVCLSVCLSVTFASCVKTNKDIFEIFFTFGQPHHSSFSVPNGMAIFQREGGASNAGGVGRNRNSELICLLLTLQHMRGDVNMVAGGRWPPSRKLWHLYRWSYTAGIRPPSATRDSHVSVVLQREIDQERSRTIHNHDRSYVWQQGLTLRRRQQNRIRSWSKTRAQLLPRMADRTLFTSVLRRIFSNR